MNAFRTIVTLLTLLLLALLLPVAALAAAPEVGDKAPDFKLTGSDGKEYSLADFAGKRAVVIAWFPKAFTGGCTAECKNMKENGKAIKAYDVAYFTASTDTVADNTKFAESLQLDYPILSDPEKKTAEAYGVVHEGRPLPERWTFYIGPDGKIKSIDKMVNTKDAANEISATLEEIGVPKK